MNTNYLVSHKSDSSNESKPKINIISDIKLPPVFSSERKINIISGFKIETKKEERGEDDKFGVKQELEKLKTEPKNELKVEEEPITIKTNENPLAKLVASSPIKDSKEDGGIPYDWVSLDNVCEFQVIVRLSSVTRYERLTDYVYAGLHLSENEL